MTARERFTAGEWALLSEAPLLAAMKVLAAGRGGNVRGTLAVVRALSAARDREHGALLDELLLDWSPDVRAKLRDRDALAHEAPGAIRSAAAVLERRACARDRAEYARLVLDLARAAATGARRSRDRRLEALAEIADMIGAAEPS